MDENSMRKMSCDSVLVKIDINKVKGRTGG
jgi:hypothetical protein